MNLFTRSYVILSIVVSSLILTSCSSVDNSVKIEVKKFGTLAGNEASLYFGAGWQQY